MLVKLVEAGRLNSSFPDQRPLSALYRFLSPSENHYNYDTLDVGLRTGLPTEREITRIQTDRQVADDVVREEERRQPTLASMELAPSEPSDDRFLRSYRYHRALLETEVLLSFSMELDLRWVVSEKRTAAFITVLDRFGLSEEMFCRHNIFLRHTAERWSRPLVRLEGDDLDYTVNFQNLVAKTTADDSELAFILLSDIKSVALESVTRTRVGPLSFAGAEGAPELQAIVDAHPGEFILSLTSDRTAVDIGEDSNGDPFTRGYREALAPEARELVEQRREALGYHVRRERKFVCTRRARLPLEELFPWSPRSDSSPISSPFMSPPSRARCRPSVSQRISSGRRTPFR